MELRYSLKQFRKMRGLTQRELAEKSGISYSMVSKLESGEQNNPSFETIEKISSALQIPPSSLLDSEYEKLIAQINKNQEQIDVIRVEYEHEPSESKREEIRPIIDVLNIENYELKKIADEIATHLQPPAERVFAQKIKGHSMEPRIYDGDIVIVRSQNDVDDGEIAVVEIAEEGTTTKQVFHQPGGILLTGLNNAVFTPRFIPSDQIKIIGKVIEVRGNVEEWRIKRNGE